jgi:hypothetical protein
VAFKELLVFKAQLVMLELLDLLEPQAIKVLLAQPELLVLMGLLVQQGSAQVEQLGLLDLLEQQAQLVLERKVLLGRQVLQIQLIFKFLPQMEHGLNQQMPNP